MGCRRVNGQCRGPFSGLAEENPRRCFVTGCCGLRPLRRIFAFLVCHVSSLLSFAAPVTTSGSRVHCARRRYPPPPRYIKGAVHPGYCSASPGRVSRHMAAMAARKDYNTQRTPGAHQSITLQHIRGGGSAERCLNRKEDPSSHWGWSNGAIRSLMCLSSSGPEREEAAG